MGSEICSKTSIQETKSLEHTNELPEKQDKSTHSDVAQQEENPAQLPEAGPQFRSKSDLRIFGSDQKQRRITMGSRIDIKAKSASFDSGYNGNEPYSPNIYLRHQVKEHELTMIKMKEKVISHKERAVKAVEKELQDMKMSNQDNKGKEKQLKKQLKTYKNEIAELKNNIEQIKKPQMAN